MSQNKAPLVSVVMPVYNNVAYVQGAILSVLQQDFEDFELIVIDDGSTDGSGKLIDKIAKQDARIVVMHQRNKGLVDTLNIGIAKARGKYIARADGDDFCMTGRFSKQVALLEARDNVVLATGSIEIIDASDVFVGRVIVPLEHEDIYRRMFIENPIAHGSTMFRKDACIAAGGYSDEVGPVEDFHLWKRLVKIGKFAAVEGYVYRWRISPQSITSKNTALQLHNMHMMKEQMWATEPPRLLTTKQLRTRGTRYAKLQRIDGVAMKLDMLADNSRIAVKLIGRKQVMKGLKQMLAVFRVGRSGAKTVFRRVHLILSARYHHVRQERNDAN